MLDDEMDEEDDEEMSDAELQEGVENEFGLVGVYGEEEEEEEGEGEEGDEGEEMDEDEEGDEEEGGVETVIVTEDAIRQVMEVREAVAVTGGATSGCILPLGHADYFMWLQLSRCPGNVDLSERT